MSNTNFYYLINNHMATTQEAIDGISNSSLMTPNTNKQVLQSTTLTKSQVGLSNVDNTNDLSKPISTSTQNALNLKANQTSLDSTNLSINNKIDKSSQITKTTESNPVAIDASGKLWSQNSGGGSSTPEKIISIRQDIYPQGDWGSFNPFPYGSYGNTYIKCIHYVNINNQNIISISFNGLIQGTLTYVDNSGNIVMSTNLSINNPIDNKPIISQGDFISTGIIKDGVTFIAKDLINLGNNVQDWQIGVPPSKSLPNINQMFAIIGGFSFDIYI